MHVSSPVLVIADYDKPFYLYVDASQFCVGACLMQSDKYGVHKPVCYYSKKLSGAQKNYSTSDREGLALVLAVRAFKTYLSDKVIVYSDHEPLRYISTMAPTNQRILRWCLELEPYNIEIKHVAGKNNIIADYLSRPCDDEVTSDIERICVNSVNLRAKMRDAGCRETKPQVYNGGVAESNAQFLIAREQW